MLFDEKNDYLEVAAKYRDKVTVVFLANVQGKTNNLFDYQDTSITTEFLTMNEYEEIIHSLQKFGFYTTVYFDTDNFIRDYLNKKFTDKKIIVFEGTQRGTGRARDSFIPSFCDLQNIVHTGPNAYVNSICVNKYHWTKLLETHNIRVPKSWRYDDGCWLNHEKPPYDLKLIAKPIYECASIGIHNESVSILDATYQDFLRQMSIKYNQSLIVQELISGYEVEVPVMITNNVAQVFPPIILHFAESFCMMEHILDYDDIYGDAYQFSVLSCIKPEWSTNLESIVAKIVDILQLNSYSRIDFRIDKNGIPYVTDINSYPHIVKHSSYAEAFNHINIGSDNVIPCIIGNCIINNLTKFEVL